MPVFSLQGGKQDSRDSTVSSISGKLHEKCPSVAQVTQMVDSLNSTKEVLKALNGNAKLSRQQVDVLTAIDKNIDGVRQTIEKMAQECGQQTQIVRDLVNQVIFEEDYSCFDKVELDKFLDRARILLPE